MIETKDTFAVVGVEVGGEVGEGVGEGVGVGVGGEDVVAVGGEDKVVEKLCIKHCEPLFVYINNIS